MTQTVPSLYDSFALYGSGVTLVTVRDGTRDRFFIASSVLTASVDPFALAVSISRNRDALPAIRAGNPWAVAMLATNHEPLVRQLTSPTSPAERDRALTAAGAVRSDEGPLWLPDALVTLWCTAGSTTPVNDQVLLVGQVNRGSQHQRKAPLLRWNHSFRTVAEWSEPNQTEPSAVA
jgi:flavin reductase (DIM6/NTAB) family NADH-FMN oxidoreductase RutF